MRTILSYGLVAVTLSTLALACANSNDPQPAKDPIAGQLNQNQTPASNPEPGSPHDPGAANGESHTPRNPHDPIAGQLNQNQTPASNPSPQTAINDPAAQKPFYLGGDGNGGNKVLAKTEKPLSDAEVLGVVLTANDGEVQMADQALKKAKSKDVKDFAAMMKTHHTQGMTKTKGVATKTKMTTTDSDLSSFLKSDTEKTIKDLKDKEGTDFDKAYMDSQVAAHKAVLAAIDNRLVPSAQNADVKSLLTETRKIVAEHITKAEDIQKKLGSTASNDINSTTEPTSAKAKTSEKGLAPRP
jgi:putative membrane protein